MKKRFIICSLIMTLVLSLAFSFITPVEAAGIKLNKTSVKLLVKEQIQLQVTNSNKKVKWSSSKKSVAKVDSKGLVTAKKAGTAYITAKIGKKKKKCKITVNTAKGFSKGLRSYILKSGKKRSKYVKYIQKKIVNDDMTTVVTITAFSKTNQLVFDFSTANNSPYYNFTMYTDYKLSQEADFTTVYKFNDFDDFVYGFITYETLNNTFDNGVRFAGAETKDEHYDHPDADNPLVINSKQIMSKAFSGFDYLIYSKYKVHLYQIGYSSYVNN